MPVINEFAVISKYSRTKNILTKIYEFNHSYKIIDIIVHAEKLLSMVCKGFSDFVDIKIILGIYFIYYRDSQGKKEPSSFFAEEPLIIRVYREDFNPKLQGYDLSSAEFAASIRGIKSKYDIDMGCKCISIDIAAEVILNLVEEKTITLKEDPMEALDEEEEEFDEIPLSSVAISRDYLGRDLKNYAITLEEISRAINHKLIEIEEEKKTLKKEIQRIEGEISIRNQEYSSLFQKYNQIARDYINGLEKLKNMESKYLREQKKVEHLELENNKKLLEINQLSREKKALIVSIDNKKLTIKDKIKQLINWNKE